MKVLVVDDDVVARMVLMHLVDSSGSFEIFEAEDGEDAWRQLEDGLRPAITFCDLRMPRLSGMELLERVRADARLAGMPFVLVSAARERETMEEATSMGADGYIVKPFQPDQVRGHLAALVGVGCVDEPPAATVLRLGIDSSRLVLYLGGLHKQLVAAGPEIEQLLACADVETARTRLARLREGCRTLGLTCAAQGFAALEGLAPSALDAAQVERALDTARHATLLQGERARTVPAVS
ncbi:response regulator [Massilia horti]|uniref:Response regulator n=1 Tax=Massilia horti TaxID=2562153 RepID=A0A4Y9T693_9BURK|nr:response regulator [Massilia horti]TFW35982.1 response regulator [Massilia horti]